MKLLNFFKRSPVKSFAEKKPSIAIGEIGDTGTSIYEGIITEEYKAKLQGNKGVEIYDKMRLSDATIKASVLVCSLPIRSANWYIEPASDDEQDKKIAEFVRFNLFENMTITWNDFLRQALLMLPLGVMLFEKIFEMGEWNGKEMFMYKKLAPRLPKGVYSWQTPDKQDGITWSKVDGEQVGIPIEKLIIFCNEKEGDNWWGNSILRVCYKHWYYKENFYKIEAVAFERQGLGVPMASLPEGATSVEETKAEEILRNIRTNEKAYVIKPDGYEIEFMDMKGGTTKSPKDAIQHHNREIVLSVLAQFLELGATSVGSRALSQDQSSLFYLSLEATAKQVADTINKYAIKQLVDLNFDVKNYPKINYSKIGVIDHNALTTSIQRLVQSGTLTVDDTLEDHLRDTMNLPKREESEEDISGSEKKKFKEVIKEDFKSWRPLTFTEQKVHWQSIRNNLDKYKKELIENSTELLEESKEKYIKDFERALRNKDRTELKKLSLKNKALYATLIAMTLKKIYNFGKVNVAKEMRVQAPPVSNEATQRINLQADMIAQDHFDRLVYESKKTAVNGLGKGLSVIATLAMIELVMSDKIKELTRNTAGIVIAGNLNQGRRLVQKRYSNLIYAMQRSEVLDDRTCNYCLSIDGRVFEKNDPFTKNDIFHSGCRGVWIEIMKDEKELPRITGAPKSLTDKFDGEVNKLLQPKVPIIKKTSDAAKFLK